MKTFSLPDWHQALIRRQFRRKAAVISQASKHMDQVMATAINICFDAMVYHDTFVEPPLSEMFQASERFYRNIVEQAYYSCEEERKVIVPKRPIKHLAKSKNPIMLRDLEKYFRSPAWRKTLRHSKAETEALRKMYLQKLRRKFKELAPRLMAGDITPQIAKERMAQAFQASKSRVDNIFITQTTSYFAEVQEKFYDGDPDIIGFLFDSVRDSRRTEICKSRHGLVYRPGTELLRKNRPACHWYCRSHLIPLANTPGNIKMLKDPARDPSKRAVVPLPPGWNK